MNREEAINQLNDIKSELKEHLVKKDIVALDMAISALLAEGEYIKKEDTIEYLNDLFGEMYHVSFGNVLQSIDSLYTYSFPDREKGEWIPVSERLPEEGRSVLVCFRSQGGMAQAVSERFNISGEWRWSALGGRKPLAWQPLPEPYKADMRGKADE